MLSVRFLFVLLFCFPLTASADAVKFKLGLFQAGEYAPHGAIRESFDRSLSLLLPRDTSFQFIATGFRSAGWNRDTCRLMARQLAANKELDLIVTVGPWVVEDLIEAGFTKPIIALFRTEPFLEGIADSTSRPLYRNLTVQSNPNRLNADITLLHRLKPFKKLGLLFFPTGMDSSRLLGQISAITKSLGAEAVTAFGHNNIGTYAFLKAYAALPADVDAIYLLPMWGLDADRIKELTQRINSDRRSSATFEGLYAVDKGVLISSSGVPYEAEARFAAWKAVQIFRGQSPQNLPTSIPFVADLIINETTAAMLGVDITLEVTTEADLIKPFSGQLITASSLSEAVTRALDLNPGFASWHDVVAQAKASAAAVKSAYYPKLSTDASAAYVDNNRLSNERIVSGAPDRLRHERYRASLSLEQPIFSMRALRESKLTNAELSSRQLALDSAFAALESDMTDAYYQAARRQWLHGTMMRRLQLVSHLAEIANGMVASGEKDKIELTRWQSEMLAARQNLSASEADTRSSLIYLNALMNQPANAPLAIDSAVISEDAFWTAYDLVRPYIVTPAARVHTAEQLVNESLHNNPSSNLARNEIDLQKSRISLLGSAWFPYVGFKGSFDLANELTSSSIEPEKSNSWTVGAFLTWTLFDGGKRGKEVSSARSRLSQLEYLRDQVSLDNMNYITSLVSDISGLAAQVLAAEKENELSNSIVNAAVNDYSSGNQGYENAAQAARIAQDAQSRLINARTSFLQQLNRLAFACGLSPQKQSGSAAKLLHDFLAAR